MSPKYAHQCVPWLQHILCATQPERREWNSIFHRLSDLAELDTSGDWKRIERSRADHTPCCTLSRAELLTTEPALVMLCIINHYENVRRKKVEWDGVLQYTLA